MKSKSQFGVTLIEMLVVIVIAAAVASVALPSVTTGLATVRLTSAASSVASFLSAAMNTVERREQPAEVLVAPKENLLAVYTAASGGKPAGKLDLPSGISIEGGDPRRFLLFPGGAPPRVTVVLRSQKGERRSIRIDPVTAVPQIERLEAQPQ